MAEIATNMFEIHLDKVELDRYEAQFPTGVEEKKAKKLLFRKFKMAHWKSVHGDMKGRRKEIRAWENR